MLFFVFGLPGGFATWCEQVVAALIRRTGGSGGLIRGETLEQVAAAAIMTGVSQGTVSSRQPGGRLRAALLDTGTRFVVAQEDPRGALIDLVLGRGIGLPDAIQQLASSCAALRGLTSAPEALILHGGDSAPPDADMIARIADYLRLPIDDRDAAEAAEALARPSTAPTQPDAVAWWNGLELHEQVAGNLLLVQYDRTVLEAAYLNKGRRRETLRLLIFAEQQNGSAKQSTFYVPHFQVVQDRLSGVVRAQRRQTVSRQRLELLERPKIQSVGLRVARQRIPFRTGAFQQEPRQLFGRHFP